MAVECIVLSGSLANTLNGTTDFTQTDFGTPTAAIVVNTSAHPITNPVSLNTTNIGFWDGTTQTAASTTSINDQSTSKTHRSFEAGSISLIQSGDEIFYAKYSIENITDGVRITCDVDNTSTERYATVILFKGTTNAYVGVQDLGTGTSAVDVTAPSFKPSIVFFAGVGAAIGTAASNAILSLGVAHNNSSDVISQGYISVSDSDGKSTANSNSYASDSSIANQQHTDTLTYEVTISAFDSSGFSLT